MGSDGVNGLILNENALKSGPISTYTALFRALKCDTDCKGGSLGAYIIVFGPKNIDIDWKMTIVLDLFPLSSNC